MEIIHIADIKTLLLHKNKIMAEKVLAVDTETTGLNPRQDRLRLIQLAINGDRVYLIDCYSFFPEGQSLLKEIMESSAIKVFQHAKFDLQFFMAWDIYPAPIFDTMIAAQLLPGPEKPANYKLETLSLYYLGKDLDKSQQISDWSGPLTPEQTAYAAEDALILLQLRQALIKNIKKEGLVKIAQIEFQCTPALAYIEYHGIHIDLDQWQNLIKNIEKEYKNSLILLYTYSGTPPAQTTLWGEDVLFAPNFDSNQYILGLLKKNKISVKATSKDDLYPYRAHPLVKALNSYRTSVKMISSILQPILKAADRQHSRIYPSYGQIISWSGRMSCYDPNIQQIPRDKRFRACFNVPEDRKLILADYSQIELRVAAKITGDQRMTDAFQKGSDLHLLTASLVLNKDTGKITKQERQAAKAVNFGLIFGMGPKGLVQYAGKSYGVDLSLEEATLFHRRFFQYYTGIRKWHQYLKNNPPKTGATLLGRKFSYGKNAGLPGFCNMPVQGTAADIAKIALGNLYTSFVHTDTLITAVIHDEILLECNASQAEIAAGALKSIMIDAGKAILAPVPIAVDAVIASNWAGK